MEDGFQFGTCTVCGRKLLKIKYGEVKIICPTCKLQFTIISEGQEIRVTKDTPERKNTNTNNPDPD